MNIAVLGTGNVGGTLGRRWAAAGHNVWFGTREPGGAKAQELTRLPRVRATDWSSAARESDVVLLAIPWKSVFAVLERIGTELAGKVVLDCINPLNATFSGLELGFTTSAAEEIARRIPAARVVKAFNVASAATMADPRYGDVAATLFFCGDDVEAKRVTAQLATDLGFAPVDTGPLANARLLEPLAMLYVYLAFHGWGGNCAFEILKR